MDYSFRYNLCGDLLLHVDVLLLQLSHCCISLFWNFLKTLKPGGFPNTQSTQHVPSTSIPSGLPLPQQLPVYSQPTLPLGPFTSLVGYPYLPQNYYLPSAAFQQAYSSNGPFHQSAAPAVPGAGMKYSMPQYKSSTPASSLPQPSSLSGYGGFGNANNIPGNFSLNQGAPSAPTTLGFDEALGTQFKDPNHYAALQQVMMTQCSG
jgi:hypothetical protein